MSDPKPSLRAKRRWRGPLLVGLSLSDDVAIAAFAHARWAAGRAVMLGPKGIVAAGVLGLAAGAAWCALDRARAKRVRRPSGGRA